MSETKTEYVVQFRRTNENTWQDSGNWALKDNAAWHFEKETKRFPNFQHRMIRVTVLKESK